MTRTSPLRLLTRSLALVAGFALVATGHETPTVAAFDDSPPPVVFERPLPAVTGSDYTIRPVWPDGFTFPANAKCNWTLVWGDDASIFEGRYNETYGSVTFDRLASDGGCGEWTFTLPYTSALQYQIVMAYCEQSPFNDSYGCQLAPDPTSRDSVFNAKLGTTDRHIRRSNMPVAYVLPNATIATVGVPVTYTLYGSDGYSPPVTHTGWSASCRTCGVPAAPGQIGGRTYTFTPTAAGHWRVGWGTLQPWWPWIQVYYDPPARYPDTSAPRVTSGPLPRAKSGAPVATTVPALITWSGSDQGWGIDRYQVQESRNGGAWVSRGLATPAATSLLRNLYPTGTYRYRVRAVDKAGNVGAWRYGSTFAPRVIHDSSSAVAWTSQWTVAPIAGALGGSDRRATAAGQSVYLKFTAQSIAWIAPKGPGMGSARVYVDGVLVATVSLSAASAQSPRIVFERRWTASGTHAIQVRPIGDGVVAVDGFARF